MIRVPTDEQIELIGQDEKVQEKARAAKQVEALKDTAGWVYLKKRFERYPELVAAKIAERFMRGDDIPQKELDFTRGYAAAIADIMGTPERVEQELEKAAENAFRRLQEHEEQARGADAPYT